MAGKDILLAWLGAGVSEAEFEAFYQEELPRIYNYFRYRVGGGPLAEDLASETFEKAWRSRSRYRKDLAAFSTWLFTIARRVAVDHYRRQSRVNAVAEVPLDALAGLPQTDTTEDAAQAHADHDRLRALLARLADRDRELVALKYGAGLTNRAIAGLTGLTESNVGVILHRVVQTLRAKWENQP